MIEVSEITTRSVCLLRARLCADKILMKRRSLKGASRFSSVVNPFISEREVERREKRGGEREREIRVSRDVLRARQTESALGEKESRDIKTNKIVRTPNLSFSRSATSLPKKRDAEEGSGSART